MVNQQVNLLHSHAAFGKQFFYVFRLFAHAEVEHIHAIHTELFSSTDATISINYFLESLFTALIAEPSERHVHHHGTRTIAMQRKHRFTIFTLLNQRSRTGIAKQRSVHLVFTRNNLRHGFAHKKQYSQTHIGISVCGGKTVNVTRTGKIDVESDCFF